MYGLWVVVLLAGIVANAEVARAAIASGFQDAVVASASAPSTLAFAPDGRLFIGEKA